MAIQRMRLKLLCFNEFKTNEKGENFFVNNENVKKLIFMNTAVHTQKLIKIII